MDSNGYGGVLVMLGVDAGVTPAVLVRRGVKTLTRNSAGIYVVELTQGVAGTDATGMVTLREATTDTDSTSIAYEHLSATTKRVSTFVGGVGTDLDFDFNLFTVN